MSPLNKELQDTLIESEAKIFMLLFLSLIYNKSSPEILLEKTIDFEGGKTELVLPISQKFVDFLEETKQETITVYCKARAFDKLQDQTTLRENLNNITEGWINALLIQSVIDGLIRTIASSCGEGHDAVIEEIMEYNETASSAKRTLNELNG